MLTPDLLVAAGLADRGPAEQVTPSLVLTCSHFGIDTPKRIAAFLAQCAVESCRFTVTRENLNYSAAGLLKTWPKRFTDAKAAELAHKPEAIANYVYASRIGNGDEVSGDGWRFRGRGLIQVTGRNNYAALARAIGSDVVANPDLVAQYPIAAESAGWYWASRHLNVEADEGQIDAISRAVNGGTLGLLERREFYRKALAVLEGTSEGNTL